MLIPDQLIAFKLVYPNPENGLLVDAFFHLNKGTELAVSLITRAKVVDPVPGISNALVRLKLVNPPTFTLEDAIGLDAAN